MAAVLDSYHVTMFRPHLVALRPAEQSKPYNEQFCVNMCDIIAMQTYPLKAGSVESYESELKVTQTV